MWRRSTRRIYMRIWIKAWAIADDPVAAPKGLFVIGIFQLSDENMDARIERANKLGAKILSPKKKISASRAVLFDWKTARATRSLSMKKVATRT